MSDDLMVSVIMPMDRPGEDARRAVASVLEQKDAPPFELIVVCAGGPEPGSDPRLRVLVEPDRNPAVRRNRAAGMARGSILAFIDDDAFADPYWMARAVDFLEANPEAGAVGGPDPAPPGSPSAELLSDTLLATRFIGSGIAAHQSLRGIGPVRRPWDVALVNLFVRKELFDRLGGFDESIGYIGEDTDLLARLASISSVWYHQNLVVRHRRRRFPGPYLRQRWRYRVKTGERLVKGEKSYRALPVLLFLAAGFAGIAVAIAWPMVAVLLLAAYAVATLSLAASVTKLPLLWWPLIPVAFALHHATYFAGILTGMVKGVVKR